MIIFIITVSTILATIQLFWPEYTLFILKCQLILYASVVGIDMYRTKQFNLLHGWIASFIFIIWSDMILTTASDYGYVYTTAIFFYLIANNLVISGYTLYKRKKIGNLHNYNKYIVTHPRYLLIFILISILTYMYLKYDTITTTLNSGRILDDAKGGGSLVGVISSALGLILPSLIAYYFKYVTKRSWIYSLMLAFPIIIFQAIISTRFLLLFQVLSMLVVIGFVKIKSNNKYSILILMISAILLGSFSSYIKENRNYSINERLIDSQVYLTDLQDDIFLKFADEMSPEGIIHMTHLANDYFKDHSLSYGKESLTILYFWVPRSWWPDKPTMLDHWLIREYENVSDAYSSASGFMGELRADFGLLSLFFAFLIGIIMKQCNEYIQYIFNIKNGTIQMVIASILYPYFFFFVRSPLTASFNLIFCYLIYYIIKLTMCKKIKNKE